MAEYKRWPIAVGVLLLFAAPLVSAQTLIYLDSSQGLDQPGLESGPTEFEMGDVNGDGDIDLVSVGDHGNPLINTLEEGIMLWFGDGTGSWTHGQSGHLGYGGVALGDVNGDGLVDVAYGIHHDYSSTDLGDQLLEVALGDGSGLGWTPWDDGLARDGQSWGMFATDLADVNGDGRLDVGSGGFGSSDGMHVYLNRGDGSWARSLGYLGGNSDHVFVFGDVDGDGHADLASAKQEGSVWLGDGEGSFTLADGNLPPLDPFAWRAGPSLGDVDADGRDDFAYCNDADDAEVWLWRGGNTWENVSAGIPATGTCQHTELHDMNGDGQVDLVTFGYRQIHVFAGDGAGTNWTQIASETLPFSPGTSEAFRVGGDVDHNGYPDMVLVAEKQISIFTDENIIKVYRESSVPSGLSVRVVRPGPSRVLLAGAVAFVDWASAVPPGSTTTVALELSTGGFAGPWRMIASGLPDNGRFQWIVPALESETCRLRVTLSDGNGQAQAISPAPFAIRRRGEPLTLGFASGDTLTWSDDLGRDRYNLYRSDWNHFVATGEYTQEPGVVAEAARWCELASTSQADAFSPASGRVVFYLGTGFRLMDDGVDPQAPMAEGTLGQRQDAATRTNAHPCPR